jgi:Mg-chelatase subunit ChlD
MLASYVHDQGGGLLIIGGERALGAGGWQGSRLEEVLPVDMEVPARRELPRGAVMLVLDRSGSMAEGFGPMNKLEASIVASIKAIESLSNRDLVGVVAFDSGAETILPLTDNVKSRTVSALKGIDVGGGTDISSGLRAGYPPLLTAASGFKHLILMTDGHSNPTGSIELAAQGFAAGISLSTIGVGDGHDAGFLQALAAAGGGRYHPVTNPAELSMAFLREASVVRRSLILENKQGIEIARTTASSELLGAGDFVAPPVFGLVLTSPKQNPRVEIPLVAGGSRDPLLAYWQSGLGRSAVFASDAFNRWLAGWVGDPNFDRFWAQLVRSVARPAESGDFDVRVETRGDRARIVVEALDADDRYRAFLDVTGNVVLPDMTVRDVRLTQTSPGTYEAEFDAREAGNYIAGLSWRGPGGTRGVIRTGTVVNSSPELRDLRSNDARIAEVAQRTGGRVLPPFDPSVSLFTREGLRPVSSPTPLRETLLIVSVSLLMLDIANRRIAWDRSALRRQQRHQASIRTTSVEALRQAKSRAFEPTRDRAFVPEPESAHSVPAPTATQPAVDVGAVSTTATEDLPEANPTPEGDDRIGGLLEAKRRARERMKREGK